MNQLLDRPEYVMPLLVGIYVGIELAIRAAFGVYFYVRRSQRRAK